MTDAELLRMARTIVAEHQDALRNPDYVRLQTAARAAWLLWLYAGPRSDWVGPSR